MPNIDPVWMVPIIGLSIAAIAFVGLKIADARFTRKHGPN
jgi:hypothetical protein